MSELVSSRIHLLPEHLIDQIKAGEVIERPANLIKEILENSLDANSTNISIHLVAGGMELISIEDNGTGMSYKDLPYAFCRHATSKIDKFEDLYKLGSYGFRGEALASIASIARVTCVSHQNICSDPGGRIVIHAGVTQSHQESKSSQEGTSLFIKDLFFNTPARLKFIKSAASEKNALRRVILSFVLTQPKTSFTVKWDDQDKKVYPTSDDPLETKYNRVREIFYGKSKALDFHHFESEYEGHSIEGFFSKSSSKGASYKKHFLFANDRLFTDRQIHQTILRSMEGLYPQGESGHYVVFLKIPPSLLDVNVHPHKTLIKFYKMQVITGLLSSQIKKLQQQENEKSNNNQDQVSFPFQVNSISQNDSLQKSSHSFSNQYNQRMGAPLTEYHSNHQMSDLDQLKTTPISRLAIINLKNELYILDKCRLVSLLYTYMESRRDCENDFIPLLITEPFRPNSLKENSVIKLKEWGFLCDKVDDSYIMLRAYHPLYELSFAKTLITTLLNHSFELSSETTAALTITNSNLETLLAETEIHNTKENFLRLIDDQLCNSIFPNDSL